MRHVHAGFGAVLIACWISLFLGIAPPGWLPRMGLALLFAFTYSAGFLVAREELRGRKPALHSKTHEEELRNT